MRLATLRDGSREGRLVVVSRDLTRCTDARRVAPCLRAALADWPRAAPELAAMARDLEIGAEPVERFHERDALSPLPWPALQIEPDAEPALRRLIAPRGRVVLSAEATGVVAAAGLAALTGPDGAPALHLLVATLAPQDADGAPEGPALLACAPVALLPETAAEARPGALHLDVEGASAARVEAADAAGALPALARAAAARGALPGGALLRGLPVAETAGLGPGRVIRVELPDASGHTLFGAIELRVDAV